MSSATSKTNPIFASSPAMANTKTNPAHAMIAGYLAGSSGTIVGYPLDSLKVWVQTNTLGKNKFLGSAKKKGRPKAYSKESSSIKDHRSCHSSKSGRSNTSGSKSSKHKVEGARRSNSTAAVPGMKQRANHIFAKPPTIFRTVRALYSGVSGPLVTVGMVQSVNFATYDATRRFLYQRQHPSSSSREYLTEDSLTNVAMSGSMGGMATAILTAPLLMIKINQQITGNSFRRAVKDVFFKQSKGRGDSPAFRPLRPYGPAFLPHALSEGVGRAIYVSSYEGLKRFMVDSKNGRGESTTTTAMLSLKERMVCAAGSGILCWATFFPLDALRNRMYHHATSGKQRSGSVAGAIWDTVLVMRREQAFYRGFSISILRAGPVAASVLPVYDMTLEWLSSWK